MNIDNVIYDQSITAKHFIFSLPKTVPVIFLFRVYSII